MKRILPLLLLCMLCHITGHSQCVIYACYNTGAWGAGYNDDGKEVTYKELSDRAEKGCRDAGGTHCMSIGRSNVKGWWAFVSGKNGAGMICITGAEGENSESAAIAVTKTKYINKGGMNIERNKVTAWLVR